MEESIFRKKSMDRITSPEALGDYLRVTNPTVWLIMISIILLLAGFLIWSTMASFSSFATGTALVKDGSMLVTFDNEQVAKSVKDGMTVVAGGTESRVSVGTDADGRIFASAPTTLADGSYPAKVIYKQKQVIRLLFN